jgi:hypothetical protein
LIDLWSSPEVGGSRNAIRGKRNFQILSPLDFLVEFT